MNDNTFHVAEDEDEINLLDLLQTIVDNLRLLILGPLAVGLAALGISFYLPPSFTATVKFLPPQQQQSAAASILASLGGLSGLAGASAGIKNPADQYLSFLKSNSVKDALIDRFKLMELWKTPTRTDARLALSGVRITSGKDGLMSVEVEDKDPKFAADLANAHVDELQKLLARLAVTEAQQRRAFFEKQLAQVKDKFKDAEQALRATGVSTSVLKSNPSTALSAVAGLKAQVTAQEVKLGAMRGYLAETAPDFKQALTELANLRAQLAKQQKDDPDVAAGQGDYVAKFREYKYQESLFELLMRQFEMAKVDESREGAVIQVLDTAEPPERKSKPNKTQITVITSLATGIVLLIFVFVRQAVRNGAKDEETAGKLAQIQMSWRRALGKA